MNIFNNYIISNDELNKERIAKIPGLSYYKSFISKDEENYLLDYISNIDYIKEFGRATKYYGFDYSHKKNKSDIKDYKGKIPDELNVMSSKIGVKVNQLVIEYLPVNKHYSFPIHSKIFSKNIMSISLGGNCVIEFENKLTDEKFEILIERRSLLVMGDECMKEWSYKINTNKSHIFNGKKIKRNDRYTLSFKNIRIIKPEDNDEVFYFTY